MGKTSSENSGSCFIQQATLGKLKCVKCKRYLSILPIYKNSEGGAICGRCPVENALDFTRDELYESAIEFQKFPCTHRERGCLEVLYPSQLADHEERCSYMTYDCPTRVYNNCTWQGTLASVLEHFEKSHPTFILKDNKFEVDFVNNHSENYVMPYAEDLYIITREGNSTAKTFAVVVKYLGSNTDIDKYIYKLTLESGNRAYKYSLEQNIGTRLELQGEIVRQMLHDPMTIIANVSIEVGQKQIETSSSVNLDSLDDDDDLDYELLKEVECPVCLEHMVPPIYQCEVGHSICKPCKESQEICPTCRAPFKKTQNFVLERIIMTMTYPCKHQGCKYKTKGKLIRQHEASCLFGPFTCPLKDYENCSDIFPVSELFNHIKKMHYESLLEFDTVSVPFDNSIEEDIIEGYILRYSRFLFKVCFMYNHVEHKFLWSVQFVGPPEESAKYGYELEIIDNNGKNMRLYLKTNCTPLVDKNETFQNKENYIYLHNDQVSKFIKNQLTYRILIINQ